MALTYINPLNHKSDAVICNGMVFVSGIVPTNQSADIKTQTQEVLAKIDALLEEAGSDRSRLVSATIWLVDINNYAAFNAVWNDWVIAGKQPARACIQATLAIHGAVEVAAIAAL